MVSIKMTANQSGPEQEAPFSKINPLARFGKPQDIAAGVLFFASSMAAYVTGQQLVVDSGLSLWVLAPGPSPKSYVVRRSPRSLQRRFHFHP